MKRFVFTLILTLSVIVSYSQVSLNQFWLEDTVTIYQYNVQMGPRTTTLVSMSPITGVPLYAITSADLSTETFDLTRLDQDFVQEDDIKWSKEPAEWVILAVEKDSTVYWYINKENLAGHRSMVRVKCHQVGVFLNELHQEVVGIAFTIEHKGEDHVVGNTSLKPASISMSLANQAYRFKINKWLFGADFVDNSKLPAGN